MLILLLLGFFGIVQQQKINYFAQELGHRWLPSVKTISEINDAFNHARRMSLRYLLDESSDKSALLQARNEVVEKTIPELFQRYEALMSTSEAEKRLKDVKQLWAVYLASDKQLLELLNKGESSFPEARALAAGASAANYVAAINKLSETTAWSNQEGDAVSNAADKAYEHGIYVSGAVIVAALAIGILLAHAITITITGPLKQGVMVAEAVAAGDLTRDIEVTGKDEVADLLNAMRQMNKDLSHLVGNVRTCSLNIAHGSNEIAIGNADLSQRTEEQASNLEETAASMEQITGTARSNSETAQQANNLASSATNAALKGGSVVDEVVHTMAKIQDASRKISEINGLIDAIAFQTNILALNAAVEAARAGEQGRGFAVVSTEVRNLAQRSATAAKEIKALIDDTVATVEVGTQQANVAGQSMKDIVSQIQGVGQLLGLITNATAEQTDGISQVGDAINQLDQVTQQNAALVEESAAAADSLKVQADQLALIVSTFKTKDFRNEANVFGDSPQIPGPSRAPNTDLRGSEEPLHGLVGRPSALGQPSYRQQ